MGPATIFDKSALQALSMDEAVWFDAFLIANVVPMFYVETLADLGKDVAEGKDPEALVGMLAEKTPSGAVPNVHHRDMILTEVAGGAIAMTGQPMIGGGDTRVSPDGTIGLHVDELPEQAALRRWREHDFLEVERVAARAWRAELAQHDPSRLVDLLKNILPSDAKISDLGQLKSFIDSFCSSNDSQVLRLALEALDVPDSHRRYVLARWDATGKPPFERFAPYTTHVFKVDLLFYLGIHRGFISGERASNKADMAYLYYLPFAKAFTSRDKLHRRTVPLFLREDQSYLDADEFKAALSELDEHYDRLPEEIKQLGVLGFASYPPSGIDNLITRLWDAHMRPDWRQVAERIEAELGKPRDREADRETVAELNQRMAEAQPVSDAEANLGETGPDYIVIARHMPATKGKWRIVPSDIDEDEGEE